MAKKISERKCVICGKKFTPKSQNASVCGDECRKELKKRNKKPVRKIAKNVRATEKIELPKSNIEDSPDEVKLDGEIPEKTKKQIQELAELDPLGLLKCVRYARRVVAEILVDRIDSLFE